MSTITDPSELSLTETAAAIRDGHLSSRRAVEACLARIEEWQPHINAFIEVEAGAALAAADRADRDLKAGQIHGPLHGVPLAHKDMFYRPGKVSACGSSIRRDWVASVHATALKRLEDAGALHLGRLHMSEFASGPSSNNYHFGHCRNPWSVAHAAAGSSTGPAVAVAARLIYGAMGSDTGGSIRMPAAYCGLVGLMPTNGRVSRYGAMPLSFSVDVVGPLTRTVADAALMLQVIAGADAKDPTASDQPVPDYSAALGRSVRGQRIGVPTRYFYQQTAPEVAAAVRRSLDVFRDLGAEIIEVDIPDLAAVIALSRVVMGSEAANFHEDWIRTRPQDYTDWVRNRYTTGLAMPSGLYLKALRLRGQVLDDFCRRAFDRVDVLHAPTSPAAAPRLDETDVKANPEVGPRLETMSVLTRPINYLGLPVLNLPAGFLDGIPTGFQLIGRPFAEARLLALGHAYEGATNFSKRAPALPAH